MQKHAFWAVLLGLIALVQLLRLPLSYSRWFCVDEIEHLHATWCVAQGLLPYRDFFEHHTPLLYYLLAPLLRLIRPEENITRALTAILLARALMYTLGLLILWLIYRLGNALHSKAAGALAVLFTLSTMMFIERTTEVRPDLLSVSAMLAALLLTHQSLRLPRPPLPKLFAAGALWALALLATPKTLFALLGYCPALLLLLIHDPRPLTHQLRTAAALLAGFLTPTLACLIFFWTQHALHDFIELNFLLNARWKFHLNPWSAAGELAYENPLLVSLGLTGALASLARATLSQGLARIPLLPAAVTTSLAAGTFIIPVPYTEYFLMPITLLAIYEAILILNAVSALQHLLTTRRLPPLLARRLTLPSLALSGAALLAWQLSIPLLTTRWEFALWAIAWLSIALFLKHRCRHAALALLTLMLSLYPARRFTTLFTPTNADQRARMAQVYTHTQPTDTVMDGWAAISAPFRPHAWYYFFLHREVRPMIPDADYHALAHQLNTGPLLPKIVVLDEDLQSLPPHILASLKSRYRPLPDSPLWLRNDDTRLTAGD